MAGKKRRHTPHPASSWGTNLAEERSVACGNFFVSLLLSTSWVVASTEASITKVGKKLWQQSHGSWVGGLSWPPKNSLRAPQSSCYSSWSAHAQASKRVHVINSLKLWSEHVPGVKSGASMSWRVDRTGGKRKEGRFLESFGFIDISPKKGLFQ